MWRLTSIACRRLQRRSPLLDRRKKSTTTRPEVTSEIVVPLDNNNNNGNNPLRLSFGKLARFADGSCVASQGHTSVLVVCVSPQSSSASGGGGSFVPLTVDYRQKAAAAGRIPTNFLRRERGVTDGEILSSRLIDRCLRPLFPKGFGAETQVVANLLAVDGVHDPVVLALNAASAALHTSDVPWNGPIGAVRVGYVSGGGFVMNPTRKQLSSSPALNLVVAGTAGKLTVMLEGEADNLDKGLFVDAIRFGLEGCSAIAERIAMEGGKLEKRPFRKDGDDDAAAVALVRDFELMCEQRLRAVYSDSSHKKTSRDKAAFGIRDNAIADLKAVDRSLLMETFSGLGRRTVAEMALNEGKRVDGRGFDDLREITCEVDLHPPLHGSALFQRGETQVFCTVALDSPESTLKSDPISALMGGVKEKNFFLHYEFPQYATNEIGRPGGAAGRRELGHGALAEKALKAVVPKDFPFTIRLTSEVLESNGSSSMATVCGGSMALLDAGVPITAPAAGVAVGLVSRPKEEGGSDDRDDYRVLVDILGLEDFLGDMDFKLAGTKDGITALQVDVKIPGLPFWVVEEAVGRGHEGIAKILDIMNVCISLPKSAKPNWPVRRQVAVPPHKRANFLGPGGLHVKRLLVDTGVQVSPDQQDPGAYNLFAPNQDAMDEADEVVEGLLAREKVPELEFGAVYNVKIVEMKEKGVFVELHPEMPLSFIPNFQLAAQKVHNPSALGFVEGQEIQVKYYGRDPVSGAVRLSRKVLTVGAASAVKQLRSAASGRSVVSSEEQTNDTALQSDLSRYHLERLSFTKAEELETEAAPKPPEVSSAVKEPQPFGYLMDRDTWSHRGRRSAKAGAFSSLVTDAKEEEEKEEGTQ